MIRDLGSRNGTFVNGQRIPPGSPVPLNLADRLIFGDIDEQWVFGDDGPPGSMLVPMGETDGGIVMLGDVQALPSEASPHHTVFSNTDGTYVLEDEHGASTLLEHHRVIEIDGVRYRVHIDSGSDGAVPETRTGDWAMVSGEIEQVHIGIRVAPDEESAALALTIDGIESELPPRAHLYLLAYLARLRITQTPPPLVGGSGEPDAFGWLDCEIACRDLLVNREHLAQMVFRIRQDVKSVSSAVAKRIVDRQLRGKMRIGFPASCLSVGQLA